MYDFERDIQGDWEFEYKANKDGQVFRRTFRGWVEIKGYLQKKEVRLKLKNKDFEYVSYSKKRLVYEAFKGPVPYDYALINRNGNPRDCRLHNIQAIKKDKTTRAAARARSKPVVQYDDRGVITNSWPSARQAAKVLHVSKSALLSILHGRTENQFNVAWEKKSDLLLSDDYDFENKRRERYEAKRIRGEGRKLRPKDS